MNSPLVRLTLLAVVAGMMVPVAASTVLYQNDFGTQAQFNQLTWTNISGSGVANLKREGPNSGPTPPGDLDGDGLFESVVMDTGFGHARGSIRLFAPLYHTMGNVTVSGYGRGNWASWSTGARWALSYDGVDWSTWSVQTDSSNAWKPYSVSAGSDPNFSGVYQVWAGTSVHSGSGTYNAGVSGRTAALQVTADVALGQPGQRVPVMLNDFGTQAQRDEWIISGPLVFDEGVALDTDNDGLSAGLKCVSPSNSIAMIKVVAPPGYAFKDPIAVGRGYGSWSTHNSSTQVRFSTDGVNFDVASTYPTTPPGWYDMTADATGNANYQAVTEFWVQIYMRSWHASYLPQARNVVVTAELVPGPEPYCGQPGTVYPVADLTGPDGVPDCRVDIYDLAFMASQWLMSTLPEDQ